MATGSSDDYNASVSANTSGEAFVTWTSSESTGGCTHPQVRFSGPQRGDPLGQIGPGATLPGSASTTYYDPTPEETDRWGDYSAVSLDPSSYSNQCRNFRRAWIVNERVASRVNWGSWIGGIGYC